MTREGLIEAMARAIAENPAPPNRIQGFHYPPHYVVRDVYLPPDKQELYRGPDTDEASVQAALRHARAMFPARAALAALEAYGAVVVPMEPTDDMIFSGGNAAQWPSIRMEGPHPASKATAKRVFTAMLAASPFEPEARDE
ncbi:hypothetical protein GCM10010964_43280 [Caldovatus sediminis]|uniref:Uncharacterized protein n=1 Tax=Caldovatus sediminis TaxID=2041189 RepID=A0A8J3EE74_9PROT|nr:hypothetical protein [Caldovatus sediminis]GGG51386.1 hypothetical protein GCM10010964_43280 [Caldovatus sediminis]